MKTHALVTTLAGLSRILRPEISVAECARDLSQPLMDAWASASLGETQVQCAFDDRVTLSQLTEGIPDAAASELALDDIEVLTHTFAGLTRCDQIRARLTVSDEQSKVVRPSPRFHVDHVGMRLEVAYLGHPCEWLPEDAVRWAVLRRMEQGEPFGGSDVLYNLLVASRPWSVHRPSTGDVLVMKGNRASARGGVHRSPRWDGRRVLLMLDAA